MMGEKGRVISHSDGIISGKVLIDLDVVVLLYYVVLLYDWMIK